MSQIDSISKSGGIQEEMLRILRKYQDEVQGRQVAPTAEALSSGVLSSYLQTASGIASQNSGSGMMSRNFVSAGRSESRYVNAQLQSFQITSQMKAAEQSTAVAILDAFGGITGPSLYDSQDNPKNGGAPESVIRKYLQQKAEKELVENAQDEFEKRREEERQENSVIPSNGESPEIDAALSPETATPPPAATASIPSAPETPTSGIEAGGKVPAPATPSLDITV